MKLEWGLSWRHGVWVLLIGAVAACKGDPPARPAMAAGPQSRPAPRQPARAAPVHLPGRGAQVIIDISQSIAGFTSTLRVSRRGRPRWSDGGSTRMSSLHHHVIERSLAELSANAPFRRCLLDATLHCGEAPVPAETFDRPETYRGSDAALDAVLRRPPSGARADTAPADPLDPFAITVLLTDGFQSTASGGGGSPDVNCAGGADPACLGALLAARVREQYGVWIGRVVMPFGGTYYPERAIGEMWPRIEGHVADLNTNHPEWTGVVFGARRGDHDSPSGAFRWEGARPLLMVVLSRDISLGRRFVAKVQEHLPSEPTIFARSAATDVAFSEMAPFEGATARIQESGIRRTQGGGAADSVRVSPATRDASGAHVAIRCSLEGVASVQVPAVFHRAARIPSYVDVVPSWRVVSGAGAWLHPVPQRAGLGLDLAVNCRQLPQGTHTQTLGIYVEWRRNAQFSQEWFIRESAETSYEAPERSFRLREMVTPPIAAATDRRGWLDQLHVSITRE